MQTALSVAESPSVRKSRAAGWGRGLCPTDVNSRAFTEPNPTVFGYLLKILGKRKQKGFVSSVQGRKLESITYTDPLSKLLMDAWRGQSSCFKQPDACFVPLPAAPFPQTRTAPTQPGQRNIGTASSEF